VIDLIVFSEMDGTYSDFSICTIPKLELYIYNTLADVDIVYTSRFIRGTMVFSLFYLFR